jgi:parallel beta-helix repeat protein
VEGFLAPATFDSMNQQSYTFDEYRIGYVDNALVPINASLADIVTNIKNFPILASELDDTGRTQRAVDFVNSKGGGIIKFPLGTYTIGNITCYSNIHFIGEPGAVIKFKDNADGFNIGGCANNRFEGLEFDGSLQVTGSRKMINGTAPSKLRVKNCKLHHGFWGIYVNSVVDGIIEDCEGYNFTQWAFYIEGCDGFKYLNNRSHDNGYDGLKMAGTNTPNPLVNLKDIIVTGNVCWNNGSDGMDIAGNNIENVEVFGNIFHDNTLRGFDLKNVYQGSYIKNVRIYDNICKNNVDSGIGFQVTNVSGCVPSKINIYDNQVEHSVNTTGVGIRIEGFEDTCKVYDNHITNYQYGIRLIDSNKARIYKNILNSPNNGIWVELQNDTVSDSNIVEENEIYTPSGGSHCIYLNNSNVANTMSNTVIRKNKVSTGSGSYRINKINDTGTIMYMNEVGYASAIPTGRATQGEIWWNSNPAASGYIGWVAVTTSGSATFKGFGAISA